MLSMHSHHFFFFLNIFLFLSFLCSLLSLYSLSSDPNRNSQHHKHSQTGFQSINNVSIAFYLLIFLPDYRPESGSRRVEATHHLVPKSHHRKNQCFEGPAPIEVSQNARYSAAEKFEKPSQSMPINPRCKEKKKVFFFFICARVLILCKLTTVSQRSEGGNLSSLFFLGLLLG